MPPMTTRSMDQVMKDFYPLPGTRIKQYVVETRAFYEWERGSAPKFYVGEHKNDYGNPCGNGAREVSWLQMDDSDCQTCRDNQEATERDPAMLAWYPERAARREAICKDTEKLSDEIAPDPSLELHPVMQMLKKR